MGRLQCACCFSCGKKLFEKETMTDDDSVNYLTPEQVRHMRARQGLTTDTIHTRIAAALDKALPKSASDVGFYQRLGVTPLVDIEAYDLNLELLADAVIAELGLQLQPAKGHYRYVTEWIADQ